MISGSRVSCQITASTRRLAAILAVDVAGYSRLMGVDEEGTRESLKAVRRELIDLKVREHQWPHRHARPIP
jgi:class 3 adenylate cyclase